MIVLVILAVAGTLAVPAILPTLESVRAESAARRTASFLDDVRRRSVLERRVLTVRCRLPESRLDLTGSKASDTTFQVPEEVGIASCAPEEVRYSPQGSASGMTLLLRDKRGRERRLTVGAFTGLARVDVPK